MHTHGHMHLHKLCMHMHMHMYRLRMHMLHAYPASGWVGWRRDGGAMGCAPGDHVRRATERDEVLGERVDRGVRDLLLGRVAPPVQQSRAVIEVTPPAALRLGRDADRLAERQAVRDVALHLAHHDAEQRRQLALRAARVALGAALHLSGFGVG